MKLRAPTIAAILLVATAAPGCDSHDHDHGTPTNATCPTPSSLTYANFGMAFFGTYCQGCHASTVTGAARNGAPTDHSFDTVEQIRAQSEHIDGLAAAGPAATNTAMPPSAPVPSMAERLQLGEWLACTAP
jgi:uncharacterized membrane protein